MPDSSVPDPSTPANVNRPETPHSISDVGTAVHRIEEAVEHTIEHGVELAEETIARRFGSRALRGARIALKTLAWAVVVAYFAFGALLLATRYAVLPRIDQLRPRVEAVATRVLRAPVTIGRIEAAWRGLNPHLALNDVRVGRDGASSLALPRVEATISWSSLLVATPRFTSLHILAPELEVIRLADGRYSIAGFVIDPQQTGGDGRAIDWILAHGRVAIRDARIRYRDERRSPGREVEFTDVNLLIESGFGTNRLALQARPPAALAGPLDVRARIRHEPLVRRSEISQWDGEIYAELGYADIAEIARLAGLDLQIAHAHGALRGWLSFEDTRISRLVADLALKEVNTQLAEHLEPLKLSSLQGRITVRRWIADAADVAGGFELLLGRLTFVTADGLSFPPLDIRLRQKPATEQLAELTEIEADRIDLESLAGVARSLPLPRELHDPIMRRSIKGTLSGLTARWNGPEPQLGGLALKTRFTGLTGAPQADAGSAGASGAAVGLPGFENLSGSIEMADGAGSLQLASKSAALLFPGVFDDPRLVLERLNATVRWKLAPSVEVRVESLVASNPDLEVNVAGNWRATSDGPGALDLSGRVVRLSAPAAHRYIPTVVGRNTLQWLQRAIVSGRLNDATVRLRGDLARFPFRNAQDGEFRIAGRVVGATLDVAPGDLGANGRPPAPGSVWPLLTGIDAELLLERASMTINAQRGSVYGARIESTSARIANLGESPVLEVNGQATGPLADMVRYVNESPVSQWIGGFTEGTEARGDAKLNLKLDIPLAAAASTRVVGSLQLSGNDVKFAGVPPFSRVNGALGFSERGVRFNNLSAGFVGGTARLDAQPRPDGATVVSATGTVTPAGLRSLSDSALLKRVLDRTQGSARFNANLTVHRGTTQLQIESDLVGLAIDGVAPLRKSITEAMPLRVERATPDSDREDLSVALGRLLAIHLERRRAGGEFRMTRGVIALNTPANLPESGLLLNVSLPRLDVEAWSNWLGEGASPAPGRGHAADAPPVDFVAVQTQELVIMRRSFRNLTLGASLSSGGLIDANVSSDNLVGQISWRPGPTGSADSAGLGRIQARLSKLVIPNAQKENVATVLRAPTRQLPSIELTAESFELGNAKLGRLDLLAQNTGTGAAAAWRLRRLDITNSDMKFAASGDWVPATSTDRQTRMRFKLDAADVGGTLTRLGFGNTMSRGRGVVEGALDWIGSPLEIDYPTLSGDFQLKIDNGRFLRVDTSGPARLLTLLSLQSLARTLGTTEARETFDAGFEFTSIVADASIARGVMTTQNFRMVGTSAAVLMSGTIDLNSETQNLLVVVLPEIDASTAALALTVVNPIVGLGTFIAQTLLRNPLSRALALEFEVTGSWTDPIVTRRSRTTPPSQEAVR